MSAPNDKANPDSAIPVYMSGGAGHGSGWAKTCDGTPLTTTTPAVIQAATTGNLRQYITGIQLRNSVNTATTAIIKTGSTIIWETYLLAANTNGACSDNVVLTTPIVCAADSALTIEAGTAGASVYWNVQGYTAV